MIATVGNVVPPLLALATQPLLAQGLGVNGRGAAAAGVAPLMTAVSLGALGLPESLHRFAAKGLVSGRMCVGALALLACIGGIATGVIWLASSYLSAGAPEALEAIHLGALFAAPALVFTGLRGIAAGLQYWVAITVARCSQSALLLTLISTWFVTKTLSVAGAVVALALAQCAGAVVLAIALLRRRRTRQPAENPVGRLEFFKYGWTIWAGAAAACLLMRLDQLLLAPLSNLKELGLYAIAVSISEVVLVINTGLREVIFSVESSSRAPARVAAATRLSNLLTLILAGGVALATPMLVAPLFGTEFVGAVPMVLVLLLGIVIGNPGSVSGIALAAWGRPGLRSLAITTALGANIVAIFVLVPPYGGVGASIATFIGNAVAMLMVVTSIRRTYGVRMGQLLLPNREDIANSLLVIRSRNR